MVQITVGDVVKIRNWFGVILEVHHDEMGQLSIIQVQTARNIFRGYGPEYIDVRMAPHSIELAAETDLQKELETRRKLQETAVTELLANMKTAVINSY